MRTLSQPAYRPDAPLVDTLTTALVESAASIEQLLRTKESEIQDLERLLFDVVKRQAFTYSWIARLKRGHRGESHSRMTRMFKDAVGAIQPEIFRPTWIDPMELLSVIKANHRSRSQQRAA